MDALSSSDPIVGWGPRGGYVFQKAFVECFCAEGCVRWLEEKVKETEKKHGGRGLVTFYAANNKVWRFSLLSTTWLLKGNVD